MPDDLWLGNSTRDVVLAASISAGLLILVWLVGALARRKLTQSAGDSFAVEFARRTRVLLLLFPALFFGARALTLPPEQSRILRTVAELSLIAQVALWVSAAVDYGLRRYRRMRTETDPAAAATVNIFRVAALVAIWIIAVLVAIDNLGFNVTTLIAGLGIGGVAVALAVQNILADLFASLSIVIDKPFIVGDTVMVDSYGGVVEYIGLKTTRIRSVNGEQLIFSNGDLLKSRIQNFKRMTRRRAVLQIGVVYQTPVEKLQRIPEIVRAIVAKQAGVTLDRVHFARIGASALQFEIVFYVESPQYGVYMDAQQAFNLELVRTFAAEGIEFAYATPLFTGENRPQLQAGR